MYSSCKFSLKEANHSWAHLRSSNLVFSWWLIHVSWCCSSGQTHAEVSLNSPFHLVDLTPGVWWHQTVRKASFMTVSVLSVSNKLEPFFSLPETRTCLFMFFWRLITHVWTSRSSSCRICMCCLTMELYKNKWILLLRTETVILWMVCCQSFYTAVSALWEFSILSRALSLFLFLCQSLCHSRRSDVLPSPHFLWGFCWPAAPS